MDGVDELERGPDRALGVVLVGDRRAPQGHHRVADELLDDPTVALDHLAREIEIAGQELADVLGVAALGHRGEADEVGEEDADEAAFGDARFVAGCGRGAARPTAGISPGWRLLPHSPQKRAPGVFADPQAGHETARRVPHSPQNFRPGSFAEPQDEQIKVGALVSPGDQE